MIGESLQEAFFTDGMTQLLQEPDKNKELLLELLTKLLTELNDVVKGSQFKMLQDGLQAAIKAVKLCAHAFTALLHPHNGYLDSDASHVGTLRGYKGRDGMLQTCNKILCRPYWQQQYDDMLKKSATSKIAQPLLANILEMVDPAKSDQNAAKSLEVCVKHLPELRQNLRTGATQGLENRMLEIANESLKEVLASEGSGQRPTWVNTLKSALQMVGKADDVKQLQEWCTEHARTQAWKGVAEQASIIAVGEISKVDLKGLGKVFSECPSKENPEMEVVDELWRAMPNIIRYLKLKVSWGMQGWMQCKVAGNLVALFN